MKRHTTINLCRLLAVFGLLMPATAHALTLNLAASISQPSLTVKSRANNAVLGTLTSKAELWPSVSLKTREHYFGNSKFGSTTEMMFWYLHLDHQQVGGQQINMGTSADGYYAYLTPTLYYRFGDRYSMESPNWMASIGIGVGVGYLNVKGSIITTGVQPQTRQSININGIGLSTGLFFEIMKKRWFFRFTSFGPSLNTGSHNLQLHDTAIQIGRSFAL
jgi:hypothetical protein